MTQVPFPPNRRYITNQLLDVLLKQLAHYHRYQAIGTDLIPSHGRTLLVVHHSLATYDLLLLTQTIQQHCQRQVYLLSDRLLFRLPILRYMATQFGAIEGTPIHASGLLQAEELVMVAPGGMREALRPSTRRYQIDWHQRLGFARLAIQHNCPIVVAACPKADELYHVYEHPLTQTMYRTFRIPLPIMAGRRGTLWPQPVILTHWLAGPIEPQAFLQQLPKTLSFTEQVERLQQHCAAVMRQLLGQI